MRGTTGIWLTAFLAICPLTSKASIGQELPQAPAVFDSVTSVTTSARVVRGTAQDEGEEVSNRSRFPAKVDRYLPMPLLQPEERSKTAIPEPFSVPISFDLETRRETIESFEPSETSSGARVPGGMGETGSRESIDPLRSSLAKNFTSLSLVSDSQNYPWSTAVKIFMDFRDTTGTIRSYGCSGTLIDSKHVITAGHCVYMHQDTQNNWSFYDWAEKVVVVPAYRNGVRPYGDSTAVQLHSWLGWVDSEDTDHDIGIIDLDRPVGALTGWEGYGYFSSCSSFTGNSFRHAGYPGEAPYNGQLMYTNSGSYDDCDSFLGVWYGNEVQFYSRSYHGQSGSGSYSPSSGSCPSCYVYAILSNGNASVTNDVRIDSSKFTNVGEFIAQDTPGSLDFVAMDVLASPGTIVSGSTLSSMSFVVHNYSTAGWSGTLNFSVYLSTNDNISSSDTILQTGSFTYSFASRSSVRVNLSSPPVIPLGLTQASYHLGIIINFSDYNSANNETDGQETAPLTVLAAPPSVTTGTASQVGQTTATLNASVNPNGSSTMVYWDFGLSTSYGGSATHGNIGSGTSTQAVSTPISGLQCGTTYHFRVRATNSGGTSYGVDRTFLTSSCPQPTENPDTTGVFRPSSGAIYLKNQNNSGYADLYLTYGLPGDYPVAGDWNGDGIDTIGIYRNGTFYLRNSNTNGFADITVTFGTVGDQPVVGDWNGDGIDTIGIYRNGTFFLRNSNTAGSADLTFSLGVAGDVGIAGDWDGNGTTTTGVFRPSNGALYLKNSNTSGFADLVLTYGLPGDKPVTGDWNGDGIDTIGVYRAGTFYLRNSNTNGIANITFSLGLNGDYPIAGDWDGLP